MWPPPGTDPIYLEYETEEGPVQLQVTPYANGDGAFARSPFCLKPYPGKNLVETKLVFNYAQSGARVKTSECGFGRLASRCPCLKEIRFKGKHWRKHTSDLILACKVVHNICTKLRDEPFLVAERRRVNLPVPEDEEDAERIRQHDMLRDQIAAYLSTLYWWDNTNRCPVAFR